MLIQIEKEILEIQITTVINLYYIFDFIIKYQVLIIGPYRSSGACCCRSFYSSLQSSIKDCNIPACQYHNLFCGRGRYPQRSELTSRGEWILGSWYTSRC